MARFSWVSWACRLLLALLLTASTSITPSVARVTLDLLVGDTRQLPSSQEAWNNFIIGFANVFWVGLCSPWLWITFLLWASCGIVVLASVTRGSELSERVLKRKRAVLEEIQSTYDEHVASDEFKQAKQRMRTEPSKLTVAQKALIATGDRLLTELTAAENDAVEAEALHGRNLAEARQADAPVAIITDGKTGTGIRRLQFHDTNWTRDGKENKSALRQHQRAEAHYFSYQKAAVKLTGSNEITETSHEAMRAKLTDRQVDETTMKELGEVLDIIDEGTSTTTASRMLCTMHSSARLCVTVACTATVSTEFEMPACMRTSKCAQCRAWRAPAWDAGPARGSLEPVFEP